MLLVCMMIISTPVQSWGILINFDSLALGNIDGNNLGGVTITSADGSTIAISDGQVGYISPLNAVTNTNFLTVNPLVLTFDFLVSSVTLTGGDRGGDLDQFTMTAFDSGNNILGSFTTPIFGGNPLSGPTMQDFSTGTVAFPNIKKVEVAGYQFWDWHR